MILSLFSWAVADVVRPRAASPATSMVRSTRDVFMKVSRWQWLCPPPWREHDTRWQAYRKFLRCVFSGDGTVLLRLDPRGLDHLRRVLDFTTDELLELRGCHRHRFGPQVR